MRSLYLTKIRIGLGTWPTFQPCVSGKPRVPRFQLGRGNAPTSEEIVWTEITVGSTSLGMLGTVASLGDGERTGLSVWHCHRPPVPCGASHRPSLDLGTGAVVPEFFKIIKSY